MLINCSVEEQKQSPKIYTYQQVLETPGLYTFYECPWGDKNTIFISHDCKLYMSIASKNFNSAGNAALHDQKFTPFYGKLTIEFINQ